MATGVGIGVGVGVGTGVVATGVAVATGVGVGDVGIVVGKTGNTKLVTVMVFLRFIPVDVCVTSAVTVVVPSPVAV